MFDNAANIVEAGFGKTCIFIASEERFAFLPDRHVRVHTAAIIFLDWFRHESRGLAIGMRNLMYDIFVNLRTITSFGQFTKSDTQLVLSGSDFVMVLVHGQAHFHHRCDHFTPNIDGAINWRYGEIPAFGAGTMTHIADIILTAGIGRQFNIINTETGTVIAIFKLHVVEHEKFRLGTNIDRIANAGRFEIGFCTNGG